jgi:hypothetical protein
MLSKLISASVQNSLMVCINNVLSYILGLKLKKITNSDSCDDTLGAMLQL